MRLGQKGVYIIILCVLDIKKWICSQIKKENRTRKKKNTWRLFIVCIKLLWMHQRNVQQTLKKRHFVCEKGKSDGRTYARRTQTPLNLHGFFATKTSTTMFFIHKRLVLRWTRSTRRTRRTIKRKEQANKSQHEWAREMKNRQTNKVPKKSERITWKYTNKHRREKNAQREETLLCNRKQMKTCEHCMMKQRAQERKCICSLK